jgi:hypothetical protein
MAYATEAHLFITDLNQSPFNVGTRLTLEDFTMEQVVDLNRRYGQPLHGPEELKRYFALVGGHPYLVRRGLREMVSRRAGIAAIEAEACRDDGPFGDHLHHLLISLGRDSELCQAMRALLQGDSALSRGDFYRLRSAGVLLGDSPEEAKLRCRLYREYLAGRLS